MGDSDKEEMKIHYVWDKWKIQYRLDLRNKLKEATEEEKVTFAKQMGLEYDFLLKRQVHKGFRNYVFYKILQDKSSYRKIVQIITELLSKNIMYKAQIDKTLSSAVPRAQLKMPDISLKKLSEINKRNDVNRREYLKKEFEVALKDGDMDLSIVIQAEITELLNKDFSIEPYISRVYSPSIPIFSKKYDFIMKSFDFSNLNYYRWYHWQPANMIRHLEEVIDVFGNPLRKKIMDLLVNHFEIEPVPSVVYQYFMLINNLLSIASLTYFNTLRLEEKVDLLNLEYTIEDYIDLIISNKTDLELKDYLILARELDGNKYHKLALKLMKFVCTNIKQEVNDQDKTFVYSILGEIHRNLKNYNKALKSFIKAYKWVENSTEFTPTGNKNRDRLNQRMSQLYSLKFRKGNCLTYVAACYGYLGKKEERDKIFTEILSIVDSLKAKKEKFELLRGLSVIYRWLQDFRSERKTLIRAQGIRSIKWDDKTLNYFDERGKLFDVTSLNTNSLVKFESEIKAEMYYQLGESAQRCFNFKESIEFFHRASESLGGTSKNNYRFLSFKKMGFSNIYLRDWLKARESFEKAIEIREDFGTEIFLMIALFQLGEEDRAIDLVLKIGSKFHQEDEIFHKFFENWTVDLFTSLKKDRFLEFIDLLKNQEGDNKWNLIYNFGIVLANHGMTELAIELFKVELDVTTNKGIRSTYYNSIGSVYSDLDQYKLAFEYFQKALEEDPDNYLCIRNIGQTFGHKGDYASAKKYLEMAIEVIIKTNKDDLFLVQLRDELDTIKLFLQNSFLTANIDDEEVLDMLDSAEQILIAFNFKNELKDASSIILGYSKALETMIHKNISIYFEPVVNKLKGKFFNKKVSLDFKNKFKNLFYKKSISLGLWIRIIEELDKNELDSDTKQLNEILLSKMSSKALDAIKEASTFLIQFRNPSSHTKTLSMDKILKNRVKIIELLNKVIVELY